MNSPAQLVADHQGVLLDRWLQQLEVATTRLKQVTTPEERRRYSSSILGELAKGWSQGSDHFEGPAFERLRHTLSELSANFAERGLTPSETATYIFSLKSPLFDLLRERLSGQEAVEASWQMTVMLDQMGLFTFESYAGARERIIKSQAQALSELATPVIQVWEGIIALPLVGSIDSARAKEIMEKLLEAVVTYEADIVIIDITGVPVVDTQVANRLMRTVEAVRLLGTRSIITGINPIIAQTLVQLGVDLSQLNTKASLRAGLQQAFRELKMRVVSEAKR